MKWQKWDSLDVYADEAEQSECVVMLHGYGANGLDLSPLKSHMDPSGRARWAFPEGPQTIFPFGGKAWFEINIEALQNALQSGSYRQEDDWDTDALERATEQVVQALATAEIAQENLWLGGFSQGSMVALHAVLAGHLQPKGLFLFSSTLLRSDWIQERLQAVTPVPFLQSHGEHDPILPFAAAERLSGLLQGAGWPGQFIAFQGGHEIPQVALNAAMQMFETSAG